jgi:O-antigen/teichoic acid export membrane protein
LFALNKSIAFPITSILSTAALIVGNLSLIPRFGVNGAAMAFVAGSIVTFLCSLCFFFLLDRDGLQQQQRG